MNRTPGRDGITAFMLKHATQTAKKKMLKTFNMIWETAGFPDEWKMFVVSRILKPDKPAADAKNVCPIWLTSVHGKLLERMLFARMQQNATEIRIFNPTPRRFRANLSTCNSLAMIYRGVADRTKGSKNMRAIVSLDIKKPFDSVPCKTHRYDG